MPLPETEYDTEAAARAKKKRDEILRLLRETAHFYLNNLNGGQADKHVEYILRRGISASVVRKFGLGASLNFRDLPRFLRSKGYSEEAMLESGARWRAPSAAESSSTRSAAGSSFPSSTRSATWSPFGGRMLEKTDFAKYKNTKETAVLQQEQEFVQHQPRQKAEKGGRADEHHHR